MANQIIDARKVLRIMRSIDNQIVLRTHQLSTFVRLKESLEHRMRYNTLLQSDLDMVKSALRNMRKR